MSKVTQGARRALVWLIVIVTGLYATLAGGVLWGDATVTPGLALDLAGGRQLIMEAVTEGGEVVTPEDLEQAVAIIRQRVDASGVAEAEISTQGSTIIVVGLPGNPSEDTINLVRQSAQLQFRPVIAASQNPGPFGDVPLEPGIDVTPTPDAATSPDATPTPQASPTATERSYVRGAVDPEPTSAPDAEPTLDPGFSPLEQLQPEPGVTDPSSPLWFTDEIYDEFAALDCTDPANRAGAPMGDPQLALVACSQTGSEKYVLGPVELTGGEIDTATSTAELRPQTGTPTGAFVVDIKFTSEGARIFDQIAGRLYELTGDRNRFAMVLDGSVISAPSVNNRQYGGQAQISGGNPGFSQESAELLANQLQFGALPLTLEVQANELVSASLGEDSLKNGLLAGALGLLLVFLYSLIQYRALGFVTIASLLIAGATTFSLISLLSWGMGYRLSLAGVAGLIVAIGITTDSFIVYFERIRDELREGRSLVSAIDHAWRRARRTILASDLISLLAAATLYLLAVGGVKGFAFTLGLVTFVDVLVVFLFTHPTMVLLAKTKFFGNGHKLSGLDPTQLGREAMYKGRGRVKTGPTSTLTLAERKAAAAKGEQ